MCWRRGQPSVYFALLPGSGSCLAASILDEEAQKGPSWLCACPCQGHTEPHAFCKKKLSWLDAQDMGGADGTKTLGSVSSPPLAATHQFGVQSCWTNACWSPVCFRSGQERSQPGHTNAPTYLHIAGENKRRVLSGLQTFDVFSRGLQSNPKCTFLKRK